ncbi:hypothetical protein RR48_07170 [Papilio machaon]|uniref:CCC domain-containing protein n=1 Tax=Papilio machaon TaxID=76193 RepID=A0A194RNU1_PAPMA|nr:hypothetical protein RR48_07170 [Papilio machaon]
MRRGLAAALAALLAVLARVTAADLVFRVPEVLVRHAAAARPVGTAGRNNSGAGAEPEYGTAVGEAGGQAGGQEAGGQAEGLLEVHYEEYFVEHDVSTAAARNAALHLDLDTVPETRVGCGACSRRDLEYCETRVLADHCCCERRFLREPFPWLPHTCYVGPGRCRPLAHDCARYTRLRDCCCLRRLAHRCPGEGILSPSSRPGEGGAPLLPLAALLAALLAARL